MATQQQGKQQTALEKQDREQLQAAIGKQILNTLGQPGTLHRVQVRHLWGDHYRANVLVGDAVTAKVAHSYFLVADSNGNITVSTPNITRKY